MPEYKPFHTPETITPEMNAEAGATMFAANDGSFRFSVAQVNHAVSHYHEMVPATEHQPNPWAARNGLMGACLAHAMGWTKEEGYEAMLHNPHFAELILVVIDMYDHFHADGMFDRPESKLS